MPKKDLTNQKFGKLTVIKDSGQRASNGGILWECQCECGNVVNVLGSNLTRKNIHSRTISCGKCYKGEDLTGQTFNLLQVIGPTDRRVNQKMVWKCQCKCGNITYVHTANLKNGSVKSCGCLVSTEKRLTNKNNSPLDLTNKKFGFLTALEYLGNQQWKCQCDCGNIINVFTSNLRSGNTISCGCQRQVQIGNIYGIWKILEKTDKRVNNYYLYKCECQKCHNISYKTITEIKKSKGDFCSNCRIIDLTGKTFNKLTVLELDKEHTTHRKTFWKCQCECGNIISVNGSNLQSGNTKSCGCLLKSYQSFGEQTIEKLLQQYHIVYEKQKIFNDCKFLKSNKNARFDFYIPSLNYLIEYDGEQHFIDSGYFKDSLEEIQNRDRYKNQWCKNNNIPLIRIPYWHLNKICIDDLLPETSKFLVKVEDIE